MWKESTSNKIGWVYEANSQFRGRKGKLIEIVGVQTRQLPCGDRHQRLLYTTENSDEIFHLTVNSLKTSWHLVSGSAPESVFDNLKSAKSKKIGKRYVTKAGKIFDVVAVYSYKNNGNKQRCMVYDVVDVVDGVCDDKPTRTSLSCGIKNMAEYGTPEAKMFLANIPTKTIRPLISRTRLSKYRSNAKRRNLEYSLTFEYVNKLLADWIDAHGGLLCRFTKMVLATQEFVGDTSATLSLDRIDSSLGYIEGNIQPVHKVVNNMKSNMTDEEFIEWTKIIANNN